MLWFITGFVCFWSDSDILILLRFLLSIEVYINVHSKATAKNHRSPKMKATVKTIAPWKWGTPSYTLPCRFDSWWTSASDEHRRNLEIPEFRKGPKCMCLNMSLQVKMNEKVIAHRKRKTPPYTFLVFLFSHSHFQHVITMGPEGANSKCLLFL